MPSWSIFMGTAFQCGSPAGSALTAPRGTPIGRRSADRGTVGGQAADRRLGPEPRSLLSKASSPAPKEAETHALFDVSTRSEPPRE